MNNQEKYFDIGYKIVNQAGKYLLNNFDKKHKITHKTEFHYGIDEDTELNSIYENYFKKVTPEVSLYTEEGTKELDNDFVWVVDPIEGTSNYRVGIPFYATQVCMLYKREPIISYIYAPSLDQFFYAQKNHGVFMNNKKIEVSNVKDLKMSLVSVNKGTKQADLLWYGGLVKTIMSNVRTFRSFGACGLEMAFTAKGQIDIFVVNGAHSIYDYSAGSLLIREAGGVVTDFNGNDWNINESTLVASNKYLSNPILNILKL